MYLHPTLRKREKKFKLYKYIIDKSFNVSLHTKKVKFRMLPIEKEE